MNRYVVFNRFKKNGFETLEWYVWDSKEKIEMSCFDDKAQAEEVCRCLNGEPGVTASVVDHSKPYDRLKEITVLKNKICELEQRLERAEKQKKVEEEQKYFYRRIIEKFLERDYE